MSRDTERPAAFTPADQRRIFGLLPTGVVAITGMTDQGLPAGFVVGTFQSLSLEPALVTFSVAKTSSTWPVLRTGQRFTANVLSTGQAAVCGALGRKGEDKFKDLAFETGPIGTPRISGSTAWIDCQVLSEVVAGDHFVIVGAILGMAQGSGHALTFCEGGLGGHAALPPAATGPGSGGDPVTIQRLVDGWTRAWGAGDTDAFSALVTADYVRHAKGGRTLGIADVLREIEQSHAAFSGFKVAIVNATAQDDTIALHWRTTARHTGTFMDVPPTLRDVVVDGASFLRLRDGLVREEWVVWDPRDLLASISIWHLGDKAGQAA